MRTRGSIVVDEIIIPIVDIYLERSCVVFVGRTYGSFPAVKQRDYVVHDASGGVVFRGIGVNGLTWRKVTHGSLEIHVPVCFDGRIAVGNGQDFPLAASV